MTWFDSHAHLQSESFADDVPAVLARAAAAGIERILLPGSDLADSRQAVALARTAPNLLAAAGVHPHEASSYGETAAAELAALVRQYRLDPIVAIGEIGLDYHYDFSPRPVQQTVFKDQLQLAWQLDLPVIIHDREATADCLAIIHQAAAAGQLRSTPGVFHCFSGSVETARILLDAGFYLGFDGPITFKNARKALEVIAICPHDRLLIETDSPYLAPVPNRGKRNEPAWLPLVGAKVADIWQCTVTEVAALTTANANRLFGVKS
jgi:TatD DNase family protein